MNDFVYHYAELRNLKFELERYEGYLPLLMRPLNMSMTKYFDTQYKAGIIDEVNERIIQERHMTLDEHVDAYIDFCQTHDRYAYLLKEDLHGID